jgi:hypothetical protein
LGLVDELGNCDSVIERDFPGIKIEEFSKVGKFDNLVAAFSGMML